MSELINEHCTNRAFHWQLLNSVSALAILALLYSENGAIASADAKPTVWIELGGQLEEVSNAQEMFAPPFILRTPRPPAEEISPAGSEHAPRSSKGGEASILISPGELGWSVSAAIRYGRSNNNNHVHEQSYPAPFIDVFHFSGGYTKPIVPLAAKFSDVVSRNSEQHVIVDFQVGKDVGLGIGGTSMINFGVRFAQFSSKSNITLRSNPDWHFSYYYYPYSGVPYKFVSGQSYHSFVGKFAASRSFHGIGPSLSWTASTPLIGHANSSEISLDWGLNAAVLFGRQKTRTHHQTTGLYHPGHSGFFPTQPVERVTLYRNSVIPSHVRSRSLTVPNIGGFAGISFRYAAAKVSFGYRGDFFVGAMDGGIDARKAHDRNFYGPFATISIGLGG